MAGPGSARRRTDLGVEVTAGAKKKVLVQQKRQDPVNYYWAEEATPDKKDDTLRNWMDKVLRVAIPANEPPTQYYREGTQEMTGTNPDVARLIGQALGVKVDIQTSEFGTFLEEIGKGNFQMYSLSRNGIADPMHVPAGTVLRLPTATALRRGS